jgi:secreted trypsin-like serine protease
LKEYVLLGPQCGRSEKEEKIVGGNEVGYYKYSWLATLRLQNNPKQLVCGGSLIGPKTVLTAAHCYKPFFKSVADGYVCNKREMINSIFFK